MKQGCPKCSYTGFAYGKIRCVCSDVPESRRMAQELLASAVSVGDLVYYNGSLLGEVTEIDRDIRLIQVKVPRFMGYMHTPEVSCDFVMLKADDPNATFMKGRRP